MFSNSIVLSDLNDFIELSQECIKPVEQLTGVMKEDSKEALQDASITLNDCLACSGCITSAETVLVQMQHEKEFFKVLNNRENRVIVVSLSSQSRASLGSKWGLNSQEVWNSLCYYFKIVLQVDEIFDIDFARDLSLLTSGNVFLKAFAENRTLIASACPGWICYVEKTHPSILHLLDSSKSPQQVMGALVKDYYAKKKGLLPNQIYHVSVMPCYDKKLEASRLDFYNDLYNTRDVDLVLSTLEIEKMIAQSGKSPSSFPPNYNYKSIFVKYGSNDQLVGTPGSASGGYLVSNLKYAVKNIYNIDISYQDILQGLNGVSIHPGRNSDISFINYTPPNMTEPTLRFSYVYGFKNIQNLVRKLKQKQGPVLYHFVEVMACPSGCINGGGQAKLSDSVQKVSQEWVNLALSVYNSTPLPELDPPSNFMNVYIDWIGNDVEKEKYYLHTNYHAVENNLKSGLVVPW